MVASTLDTGKGTTYRGFFGATSCGLHWLDMQHMKPEIIITIVGWPVTAVFAYFSGRRSKMIESRRAFISAINHVLDATNKEEGIGLTKLHKNSISQLRPEFSRVIGDIKKRKKSCLQTAWDNYCKEADFPLDAVSEKGEKPGQLSAKKLGDFEEGRLRLMTLLEELKRHAK